MDLILRVRNRGRQGDFKVPARKIMKLADLAVPVPWPAPQNLAAATEMHTAR
jgi:hypothetical protein